MQRLRALASWMTTGAVTLALALAVVVSGQLAKVPTPVASPPVTTVAVSHHATAAHTVVRAARSTLVAMTPVQRHTTIRKAPARPANVATTTVPATTTSTSTTTTTTTTTSTTTTTLPPVTTTTRPHRGDGGGGSGSGGGSDDPPGSD